MMLLLQWSGRRRQTIRVVVCRGLRSGRSGACCSFDFLPGDQLDADVQVLVFVLCVGDRIVASCAIKDMQVIFLCRLGDTVDFENGKNAFDDLAANNSGFREARREHEDVAPDISSGECTFDVRYEGAVKGLVSGKDKRTEMDSVYRSGSSLAII